MKSKNLVFFAGLGILCFFACFNGYSGEIVKEKGLVAYWSFDEGKGEKVSDLSGNGNDGVIEGEAGWVEGIKGKALMFNGEDVCVDCGDKESLDITGNAITIEAWVKMAIGTTDFGLVNKGGWGSDVGYYAFVGGGGRIQLALRIGGEWQGNYLDVPLNDGNWYHWAGVYDGKKIQLYANGKLCGTLTGVTGPIESSSGHNFKIGFVSAAKMYFDGIIDELKIYNRALSEKEIKTSYEKYEDKALSSQ